MIGGPVIALIIDVRVGLEGGKSYAVSQVFSTQDTGSCRRRQSKHQCSSMPDGTRTEENRRRADDKDVDTSERSEVARNHHGAATNPANTSGEGTPGGVVPPRRDGIRRIGTEMLPRSSSDDPNICWIQMWSCWLGSTDSECLLSSCDVTAGNSTADNLEQMGDKAQRRLTMGQTMEGRSGQQPWSSNYRYK
jgi:hypothetical protein